MTTQLQTSGGERGGEGGPHGEVCGVWWYTSVTLCAYCTPADVARGGVTRPDRRHSAKQSCTSGLRRCSARRLKAARYRRISTARHTSNNRRARVCLRVTRPPQPSHSVPPSPQSGDDVIPRDRRCCSRNSLYSCCS